MPNLAAPEYSPPRYYSPYLPPPPPSTISPPVLVSPGFPVTTVGTHSGDGCGCGGGCGSKSVPAAPFPATAQPLTSSAPSSGATAFAALAAPKETAVATMLESIDWSRDWWKFVAGALAYKLLAK